MTRVCRYCSAVAGSGAGIICPGPSGLVGSHSWHDVPDALAADTAPLAAALTGYRCQWCEQPCGIEENQRGACDECTQAYDDAERIAALLDSLREAA